MPVVEGDRVEWLGCTRRRGKRIRCEIRGHAGDVNGGGRGLERVRGGSRTQALLMLSLIDIDGMRIALVRSLRSLKKPSLRPLILTFESALSAPSAPPNTYYLGRFGPLIFIRLAHISSPHPKGLRPDDRAFSTSIVSTYVVSYPIKTLHAEAPLFIYTQVSVARPPSLGDFLALRGGILNPIRQQILQFELEVVVTCSCRLQSIGCKKHDFKMMMRPNLPEFSPMASSLEGT